MSKLFIEKEPLLAYLENMGVSKYIISTIDKEERFHVLDIDEIAAGVEEKMTYMCGCLNCIDRVTAIITNDNRAVKSHCNECGKHAECLEKWEHM